MPRRIMLRIIPVLLAMHAITFTSLASADLTLDTFWVRAMPPGQPATAAYGRITNTGTESTAITGASADFAKRAELHESVIEGGTSRMRAMGPVTLAPDETLELKPGGAHLMLMGITTMPAAESEVTLCVIAGSDKVCSSAPVLRAGPADEHDGHAQHMNH